MMPYTIIVSDRYIMINIWSLWSSDAIVNILSWLECSVSYSTEISSREALTKIADLCITKNSKMFSINIAIFYITTF